MKQTQTNVAIMTKKSSNFASDMIVVNTKSFVRPSRITSAANRTLPGLFDKHGFKIFLGDSVPSFHFCEVSKLRVFLLPSIATLLALVTSNTTFSSFVIRQTTMGADLFGLSFFVITLFVYSFFIHVYHYNTVKPMGASSWPNGEREDL